MIFVKEYIDVIGYRERIKLYGRGLIGLLRQYSEREVMIFEWGRLRFHFTRATLKGWADMHGTVYVVWRCANEN